MVLHVLLVGDQHLELELGELLQEGHPGGTLGDQLVVEQLPLEGLLVLIV